MRLILALFGMLSTFVAPAWVPLIVIFLLSVRYPAWEVIVIGLLLDILWQPVDTVFFIPIATTIAIIVVWACEPLRRELLVGDAF